MGAGELVVDWVASYRRFLLSVGSNEVRAERIAVVDGVAKWGWRGGLCQKLMTVSAAMGAFGVGRVARRPLRAFAIGAAWTWTTLVAIVAANVVHVRTDGVDRGPHRSGCLSPIHKISVPSGVARQDSLCSGLHPG